MARNFQAPGQLPVTAQPAAPVARVAQPAVPRPVAPAQRMAPAPHPTGLATPSSAPLNNSAPAPGGPQPTAPTMPLPAGAGGMGTSASADMNSTPTSGAGQDSGSGEGYADGGVVPGPDDQGQATPAAPDLSDALDTVQQALQFGRQKSGMGGGQQAGQQDTAPGFADGGEVPEPGGQEDDTGVVPQQQTPPPSPMPSAPPTGAPSASPQQGVIPQQGGPQPGNTAQQTGGAPPSIAGYVRGADAVQPEVAQAMEQQVDPQGQMDPNARTIATIAAGQDPQQQWGLMQHYRQKFEAYKAFSQAAANGTQQKPSDIAASTKAATQAFTNVPDGNDVKFAPAQGGKGVQVSISKVAGVGGGKGGGKTKGYDAGGSVDPEDADSDQGVLPGAPFPADNSGQAPDPTAIGGGFGGDTSLALPPQNAYQPSYGSTPLSIASSAATAAKNYIMSTKAYQAFMKDPASQYDTQMDGDVGGALGKFVQNFDQTNPGANATVSAAGAGEGPPQPPSGMPAVTGTPPAQGAPAPQDQAAAPAQPQRKGPYSAFAPDIVAQAFQNFPQQGADFHKFLMDTTAQRAEQQSKFDVAGNQRSIYAKETADGRNTAANITAAGHNADTQARVRGLGQVAGQKLQGVLAGIATRATSESDRNQANVLSREIQNIPLGTKLPPMHQAVLDGLMERNGGADQGQPAANAPAPAPQASGNTPPVNLLKEGQATTFKNGQKWTLRGGQPMQVQ